MLPYTTKPHSQKTAKSKYLYDLASAVVHRGKLEAGHYFVYCRQGDQVNPISFPFFLFFPFRECWAFFYLPLRVLTCYSGCFSTTIRWQPWRRWRSLMLTRIYCSIRYGLYPLFQKFELLPTMTTHQRRCKDLSSPVFSVQYFNHPDILRYRNPKNIFPQSRWSN